MRKISRSGARVAAAATAVGGFAVVGTVLATMAGAAPAGAGALDAQPAPTPTVSVTATQTATPIATPTVTGTPTGMPRTAYGFITRDNANDVTFNQLSASTTRARSRATSVPARPATRTRATSCSRPTGQRRDRSADRPG